MKYAAGGFKVLQDEILAISEELAGLAEFGYDYRTLILGYDQLSQTAPIQLLFSNSQRTTSE